MYDNSRKTLSTLNAVTTLSTKTKRESYATLSCTFVRIIAQFLLFYNGPQIADAKGADVFE